MTGKIIFILTVVTIFNGADAFKQLNANIDKMIARIENKTKGLMEDGKAIVLYNRTTSNDNDTHSYMIQKEKEKLSIIPMIPIGIKNSNKPPKNEVDGTTDTVNVNDSEYEDIYESEEEKDKGGWKPIRLDENDTNDKKDGRKSTAMPPPATTTITITTTTKKPCSCGKLIKGLN